MPTMPIERRAARAAKKRNRKIAQAYPLFADQFAVSVESQVERLKIQDAKADELLARHKSFDEMQFALGMQYREVAHTEMPAEQWQDYEARYLRIFGRRDLSGQAAFLADWWHCALRDNGSKWLQNNCARAEIHEWECYRREGKCPNCGRSLTPLAPVAGPTAQQMTFILPAPQPPSAERKL
jgi:hypothetical protein